MALKIFDWSFQVGSAEWLLFHPIPVFFSIYKAVQQVLCGGLTLRMAKKLRISEEHGQLDANREYSMKLWRPDTIFLLAAQAASIFLDLIQRAKLMLLKILDVPNLYLFRHWDQMNNNNKKSVMSVLPNGFWPVCSPNELKMIYMVSF